MVTRLLYTTYLICKERKLGNVFVMAGDTIWFLFYMNFLTILCVVFYTLNRSFGEFFIEYKMIILTPIIIGFYLAPVYAKHRIKKLERNRVIVVRIKDEFMLAYAIISFVLLLIAIGFFSKGPI